MKALLSLILILLPSTAFAQNAIIQNGAMTKYDIPGFIQNHTLDSGSKMFTDEARGFNPPHIFDSGSAGLHLEDGLTTGPYHHGSLGHDSSGNFIINLDAHNGAAQGGCLLEMSGFTYPCFSTVTGQTVAADNTALKALSTASLSTVVRQDYAAGIGAPAMPYDASANPCTLNGGLGDNGKEVISANGKCWIARTGGYMDWREYGVATTNNDNQAKIQAAWDAGKRWGITIGVCGAGDFPSSHTYFYNEPIRWCSHTAAIKRLDDAVMIFVNALGRTYPDYPYADGFIGFDLWKPTINMNADLMATRGGGGLVASAAYNWNIYDPFIYNIPTNETPSGVISGAPRGTWKYTAPNRCPSSAVPCDAALDGWVVNAGIALLGSAVLNIENGGISGGAVGNFDGAGCGLVLGAAGIALTVPSQMMQTQSSNPANGNVFLRTLFDCNTIGFRNDYASGITLFNADTTSHAGFIGIADGTYGRYDITVAGTASGTSNVYVTMMANGLTGSPVTVGYSGTGNATVAATKIVSDVNGSAALAAINVTAGLWPNCAATICTLHISYGDEFSSIGVTDPPLNFAFCAAGNPTNNTNCSGALTLTPYHTATWNKYAQTPGELDNTAYMYVGANAGSSMIELPQQLTGSPYLVMNHGGPNGTINPPTQVANYGKNASSRGTSLNKNSDGVVSCQAGAAWCYTIDCNILQSPIYVDTSKDTKPFVITPTGSTPVFTQCKFKDAGLLAAANGGWDYAPFQFGPQGSNWGVYKVGGQALQTFARKYGTVELELQPIPLSNTITGAPGNNAGGDWIGGGDANAALSVHAQDATTWTSNVTASAIGTAPGTLSLWLAAGTTYNCKAGINITASAAGGFAAGVYGTGGLSATSMSFRGQISTGPTINTSSKITSLGALTGYTGAATYTEIEGSITTNAGGVLSILGSQNASSANATTAAANSFFNCSKAG
jgi:hypothetical protein